MFETEMDCITREILDYADGKNEEMIYVWGVYDLVGWAKSPERTIKIIKELIDKEKFLCFMEDGFRTDIPMYDEELIECIYSTFEEIKSNNYRIGVV